MTLNQIGCLALCKTCGKAIQLVQSHNPDTGTDYEFWVHHAPLVTPGLKETHKAILKPGVLDVCPHIRYSGDPEAPGAYICDTCGEVITDA